MYHRFASYYDRLMGDADYPRRTDELCRLFRKYDRMPKLLLDLACGTGGFSNEMAARGVQVIGADISPEMLSRARENSERRGFDVLYLCQDAAELDLYGTVDGAICCLDSLNHITDYAALCRALARVSLFLEKDRLFIFDVNTRYKHEQVLADNIFILDEADVYCVWENEYDAAAQITTETLDFFERQEDGLYIRSADTVTERFYTHGELEQALSAAGLEIAAVCGEFSDSPPDATAERAVYITRKA